MRAVLFLHMIVGLTGGIGSGKSTVARLLAERGAAIIDTDVIAREVVEPPSALLDRLREEFGPGAITADGRLDREAVAGMVFSDEAKRRRLNELTHPEILKRVLALMGQYPPSAIVVVVVPLLFESGFERNCHRVIAVVAPQATRIRRVMLRDGISEDAVRARMQAQLADADYERKGATIIRNTGDAAALETAVDEVWRSLAATPA
jgi:dephospho-CoA kinase